MYLMHSIKRTGENNVLYSIKIRKHLRTKGWVRKTPFHMWFKTYRCARPLLCTIMASGVRCPIFIWTEGVFKALSRGKWVTRTLQIRTTYSMAVERIWLSDFQVRNNSQKSGGSYCFHATHRLFSTLPLRSELLRSYIPDKLLKTTAAYSHITKYESLSVDLGKQSDKHTKTHIMAVFLVAMVTASCAI